MPTNLNGFVVFGAIEAKWLAMGGVGSPLGAPTSNEAPTFDGVGRGQSFQNGFMSWHPELGAFAVYGLIGVRWNELGREVFGYPITDELGTPNGGGRFNHFRSMQHPGRPEASIYWTAETGPHEVFGAIRDKWASMGWETSPLGFPKNGEEATFDTVGRFQLFQGGIVSWHPELGAHVVWGLISARWWELGREQYGYPITDETTTPDGAGRFNHFRAMHIEGRPDCSIYWHPDTGAHEVFGAIRGKWAELGWETGTLGYPTAGEAPTFDGVGRVQTFVGGTVSWHPQTGAHAVWGLIGSRWWEIGREQFGYPLNDETGTPNGRGRFNHFRQMQLIGTPDTSIYWHPDTGAHEVYGDIRRKWAELGWETSPLGYPVGAERDRPGGGRIQDFQFGAISWTPARGPWVDWVRMRRGITTPAGTALGGWAELELHADGNYHFRGHMHDSGFDSYEFRVRAAIASTAGVAIVAQKTGDVQGTSSGFSPRRNFDWDDAGFSALMASEWHDIDLRTFGVAKSYENTGVLGGLESLATDVLSFLIMDVALGPSAALIILIGNELSEISGASVFGVGGIPGVLVTAGTSFLVGPAMAIPIFVGTAVVTNALVKHRKLSEEEYDFANVVYQGTLPPIDRITMTNLSGIGGRAFVAPNADGTVLMNISDEVYSFPGGPIVATHGNYPVPGQVLIHELAHAWQLQRNGFVPGYVCSGATSSNYQPPAAGSNWSSDFNIEQQATTVDQWFQRHASGWNTAPGNRVENLRTLLSSAAAMRDDYFPYISNNIRMAQN